MPLTQQKVKGLKRRTEGRAREQEAVDSAKQTQDDVRGDLHKQTSLKVVQNVTNNFIYLKKGAIVPPNDSKGQECSTAF